MTVCVAQELCAFDEQDVVVNVAATWLEEEVAVRVTTSPDCGLFAVRVKGAVRPAPAPTL